MFFATPNGTAMNQAPALLEKGIKVVDLSADFRLKDVAQWQQWCDFSILHNNYWHRPSLHVLMAFVSNVCTLSRQLR